LFEVPWGVMHYTTVLALEFAPVICEKCGWNFAKAWLGFISVPLVIIGVILSTLHQSSLGSLYLIVPARLYPLWYSPLLPILFFVSAICVGMAMTIFESWHSSRAFGRNLHASLLESLGRVLAVALAVYLVLRYVDIQHRHAFEYLWIPRTETYLFWFEVSLFAIGMLLLFQRAVRSRPVALYGSSLFVIFGFLANRLNVSITGMQASAGVDYIPRWTEIAVTLAIIALGFAIFRAAAKNLPLFEEDHEPAETSADAVPERPAEDREPVCVP
jgi:Ni/Fe-hydrogenase subunit HybB-like protein